MGFSLVAASGGYSLVAVHRLLIAVASRGGAGASGVVAPGLWGTGLVVVAHGVSCSMAHGILPDQGLNPCLLNWQADFFFLPLSHQGSLDFNLIHLLSS